MEKGRAADRGEDDPEREMGDEEADLDADKDDEITDRNLDAEMLGDDEKRGEVSSELLASL